ncbi:MAG: hypothetical protein MUC78_07580 [Bacteroidales bacterium]|jgi:hypothetical protein|nr:hypothetical protein [Bacteroidales bacterium]
MRQKIVFIRFAVTLIILLFAVPVTECNAQRSASRKAEKELFGKTGKSKPANDKVRVPGAAGKAMREQEKKEARRDKEEEKAMEELRKRHISMQNEATRERMANNQKKTEVDYKAKKERQNKKKNKIYANQNEATRERMTKNEKKTQSDYKAKKQKQRKEQRKPGKRKTPKP